MSAAPVINLRFNRDGSATGDPGQSALRRAHLHDLERIDADVSSWRTGVEGWARNNVFVALAVFLFRAIRTLLWTLILAPATAFIDPLGTAAALTITPLIQTALVVVAITFAVGKWLGLDRVMDRISDNYADGYSAANWPSQTLFGPETIAALQRARPILEGRVRTTEPQEVDPQDDNPNFTRLATTRIFSVPLARVMLAMSAIVYERRDRLVQEANEIAREATRLYQKGSEAYNAALNRAESKLVQSEEAIKLWAAKMGLAFDGISDLASVSGPFASLFFSPVGSDQQPFMVLCFKGTTPVNYSEWLVDASIAKTGATVWYGGGSGAAHEGFYHDLFGRPGAGGANGYASIVHTIKHLAQRMKAGSSRLGAEYKIPLFLAGHSLGAALASLMFARLLRSESDLGEDIELRDCYTFGTPRIGNGDFAGAFEASLVSPIDRSNILWRVVDNQDVVCKVPPGLADDESLRGTLSSLSVLNYAHLGPSITIRPARLPWQAPYFSLDSLGSFHEATEVKVTGGRLRTGDIPFDEALHEYIKSRGRNPLRWVLGLLPPLLYDHFPAAYEARLSNVVSTTADRTSLGPSALLDTLHTTHVLAANQLGEARQRAGRQVGELMEGGQRAVAAAQSAGRQAVQTGAEVAQDVKRDLKQNAQKKA